MSKSQKLGHVLTQELKRYVTNSLWQNDNVGSRPDASLTELDTFFAYYEDQCQHAQASITTHREVLDVIETLRDGRETCETLKQKLETSTASESEVDASIALAVRVWLMMYVGNTGPSITPGYTQIFWKDGTVDDLIANNFSPIHELNTEVKLSKIFNVYNLQRISGIRVSWTNNLADHLSMRDDDTRLMIFHHATFLEQHMRSKVSPFPKDFLAETLRTLSLLIPPNDPATRKWFKARQTQFNLDPKSGRCEHLNSAARQIEHFKYWRDRLVILKQAFDESEPKTIRQWWNDDRKKVQWYTFWIAALVLILTIVFGLIQSVSGIVQAWASIQSIRTNR